ncbi:MAG TPA: DEAD/DEAH box helicase [Polyangiaceae bacterium]|jgi:superfamily II DNA/RNA helicase|nr:DEAD/DEAH box helicase [Polyangiaceae bacterium]
MEKSPFVAAGLEVDERLATVFQADGITEPTAVQTAAFRPILAGEHVILQSGTGTGKTLAYLLPLLQRLRDANTGRVVVFAPATELALQTLRVADRYKDPKIASGALVATASIRKQKAKVQQSTRLVVGTTGRILEQFADRKLKGVTTIVLDEPDPILATQGADYLREILSRPEPKVQLIFAAATLGASAKRLAEQFMGPAPVHTRVESDPLDTHISHHFLHARAESSKDIQLAHFIEEEKCERAIVFVNQPNLIRHLYRFLSERNLKPVSLSTDRSKLDRQNALRAFTRSEARVLITTDQAMTGIDVPDVPWVLHYELPSSALAYVHRAGRTGRAGKQGQSVLVVTREQRPMLERFGKELGIRFTQLGQSG